MRWHEVSGEQLAAGAPPAAGRRRRAADRAHHAGAHLRRRCRRATSASSSRTCARCRRAAVHLHREPVPVVTGDRGGAAGQARDPPRPDFRLVLVLPAKPNSGGDDTRGMLGELIEADDDERTAARVHALRASRALADPVYVHAKIGDRRRRVDHGRLGKPQRALAVQRHRDERRRPRPRARRGTRGCASGPSISSCRSTTSRATRRARSTSSGSRSARSSSTGAQPASR